MKGLPRTTTVPVLAIAALVISSCSQQHYTLVEDTLDAGQPSFGESSDASTAESPPGMCASNACPEGRTTCPNNPFPCAVDLSSDDENCGACGVRCPTDRGFSERVHGIMRCVGGTCRLVCDPEFDDCNGLPEDGCEASIMGIFANDVRNCGACGNVCSDICTGGACGCGRLGTLCPDHECHDLDTDPSNCGACGKVCPPSTNPTFPPALNIFEHPCKSGKCNVLKCAMGWADCNDDFKKTVESGGLEGDGCEVSVSFDSTNCGGCGIKCSDGEWCFFGMCSCPCGAPCYEALNSDPFNCGTCGHACPGDWGSAFGDNLYEPDTAHGKPVCEQGVCGYACNPDWADCDGDVSNGCETNLLSDPLNCGACGVHCDGVEGQPCIDGWCLTKECGVQ